MVRRNAYGRQVDSFESELDVTGYDGALRAVFIRAPKFEALGPDVEVLASLGGEPVLVRQGRILAGTFHPELTGDSRLHRQFVRLARPSGTEARRVRAGRFSATTDNHATL